MRGVVWISHEGMGGVARWPGDDDPECRVVGAAFDTFMSRGTGQIGAAMFGDQRVGGVEVIGHPCVVGGCDFDNGVMVMV